MTSPAVDACRVCGAPVEPLFRSPSDSALTSSAIVVRARTNLDACSTCGHVQTQPIADLDAYYSDAYRFRAGSAEEDDLCSTDAGTVFRSDLQAAIVDRLIGFKAGDRVLDYGSGKARTLRLLAERHSGVQPYAFDVSDSYREHWDAFIARDAQAAFAMPDAWRARFDAVLSFFALEHVERPAEFVEELYSLVRPGGRVVVMLPNMYRNVSDFVVVDHVNHFSASSLRWLFSRGGFADVRVDAEAQTGWFVVSGERGHAAETELAREPLGEAREIATFWSSLASRVREAESRQETGRVAIYGSGIYGLFVAGALRNTGRIAAFLDRNPFRQGLEFFGAPVVAPEDVPADVALVYVGLNPLIARDAIGAVAALASSSREFFYV